MVLPAILPNFFSENFPPITFFKIFLPKFQNYSKVLAEILPEALPGNYSEKFPRKSCGSSSRNSLGYFFLKFFRFFFWTYVQKFLRVFFQKFPEQFYQKSCESASRSSLRNSQVRQWQSFSSSENFSGNSFKNFWNAWKSSSVFFF